MGKITKAMIKREIQERIKRKEERIERQLTQEEIDKIEKGVIRKVRRENTIRAAWLSIGIFLGIGAGAGGHALLTAGNEPKQPNGQESESEVDIDKKDEKIEFKNGLSVSIDQLDTMNQQENQLRKSVEAEIDELDRPQEVIDYLKNIYVDEYNNKNEQKITPAQLKIYKNREDLEIYKSTAENGDEILRSKSSYGDRLYNQTGVVTVYIQNENETQEEQIANVNGKYETLYDSVDKVEKYEDNCLVDVAGIMDTGIDWLVAMDESGTSYEVKKEYKNRFIEAVTEYKTEKTSEIEDQER